MQLVDDQVVGRYFQRLVARPVVVLPNDLAPVRKGIVGIRGDAPYGPAGDGSGVGVQQHAALIVEQALPGVVRSVKAIPVFDAFNVQSEDHHGVDIADPERIREWDLHEGLRLPVTVQHEGTGGRLPRKDAEIDPVAHLCGAKGDLEKPHFAANLTSENPVKQGFFTRQCLRKQGFSKLPKGECVADAV